MIDEGEEEEVAAVPLQQQQPPLDMRDIEMDAMLGRLTGINVLVDVLREHTVQIRGLRVDIARQQTFIEKLGEEAQGNRNGLKEFQDTIETVLTGFRGDLERTAADVEQVKGTVEDFRKQVTTLSDQIADFPEIKKETLRQKDAVESVVTKMEILNAEMALFLKSSNDQFESLEVKSVDFEDKLGALRKHVESLPDTLVLSSNQITVAASAGFASKPMNLFEILKLCNTSIMSLQGISSEHTNQIADNVKATSKKADETVLVDIHQHDTRLLAIEDKLRRDEEEGVNALRKSCKQLAEMVEHLKYDMDEKVRFLALSPFMPRYRSL